MAWKADYDCFQVTVMASAWYEVLSVLHLMAMLCLSEANALLLPKMASDGYQQKTSEGEYCNAGFWISLLYWH